MRARGFLLLVCILGGCAAPEILVPKSGEAPPGVDFSGSWQLRANSDAARRRIDAAIRRTDGVDDGDLLRPPQRDRDGRIIQRRGSRGGLVHVFLQHGERLTITQTGGAIFISFDRAVVEEFRFGEHRQVRVGPVLADRVSGWEGAAYVVETLDENRMKLTERFEFGEDRDTLRRTIVLRGRNQESETIVQEFGRVDAGA